VIPLESLENGAAQEILSHLRVDPALPGHFSFLTPRMLGFVADAPLPAALRVRVTISKGLTDVRGRTLDEDYTWTFQTEGLALTTDLPDDRHIGDSVPGALKPEIRVFSNAELDTASLLAHARLVDAVDAGTQVSLTLKNAAAPSPTPADQAPGEREAPKYTYTLLPVSNLQMQRRYRLEIEPGVASKQGNVPGGERVVGLITTFGPLRVQGVTAYGKPTQDGVAGRFVSGVPQLVFTNGLVASSVSGAVSLQPAAPNVPLTQVQDGDTVVTLNPEAFLPNTHYVMTIASGVKDVFGQTLGRSVTQTFDTGALAGDLWAPSGFTIFPASADLALNIISVNLLEGEYRAAYRAVKPEDLVFTDLTDTESVGKLLPPQSAWSMTAAPADGKVSTRRIPLRKRLGAETGVLAYGVIGKTNEVQVDAVRSVVVQPSFIGAVELTNIGVFAQWFPDMGIVRAHRLSDGTPIAGASVTIYPSQVDVKTRASVESCASGVTDAGGTLQINAAAFARCAVVAKGAGQAPSLLAVVRGGADWAFVRTGDWSGAYGYGVPMGWSAGAPQAHGGIVSDRGLYQPGETAYVTGIAYFDTNGVLSKARAAAYRLMLESPGGTKRDLGMVAPDAFGSFTREIPLEKHQELGYYMLHARAANGEELFGTFRVAEFKPPNFKVALSLDRRYATVGQSVNASWMSAYLFGSPVQGGNAHVDVTRERAYFTPEGREAFAFGRQWLYPEEEPSVPSDVLQQDATVPADGKNAARVTVAGDLPYPMAYQVDAQTRDASNQAVDDTKMFTALPSDRLIGMKTDFVAAAGRPQDIALIVTDPDGKPRADRRVHVVLQERSYASATQLVEGSQAPVDAVHYSTVASADIAPSAQETHVSLTPPKAGAYRLRANFADAKSDATATDSELWVSGPGQADWGRDAGNALTVKLDKATYHPGETARVLVQSPYPRAELWLAVVRHGVLLKKTILVQGSAPQASFIVTSEMLPNAAVEAVLVRRGAPLKAGVGNPERSARIGFASFNAALDAKYLKVTLTPERDRVEPQQAQTVRVRVTDAAGRGVRAEMALAVVNDAVLQLNGYRFPDLVRMVYEEQPISTRFADNRDDVTLASPGKPVEKGFGYGGGFEAGAAGTRVRTQFKPIAFYNGALKTDASGNARISFKAPDDLTTWRVSAMAFSADARFGNGETTFIATKPLVTNAVLPLFARPGDTFSGGVAVTDTRKEKGNIGITGVLTGDLGFLDKDRTTATTLLSAALEQPTQAFRFPMRVTGSADASVQFTTILGDRQDAFQELLPIRSSDVLESVVQNGVTDDRIGIPLDLDAPGNAEDSALDITLASTLVPETREVVSAALADDMPFASAVAGRVAVAADAILLNRQYKSATDAPLLQGALARSLDALRALQREDGGYASWPGARRSDISVSALCAESLMRARAAGMDVSADVRRVREFLLARLNDPSPEPRGKQEPQRGKIRLEALEALGALGERRSDHLADIYARRKTYSFSERIGLARYLLRLPAWSAQAVALREEILGAVHLTARVATLNAADASPETATAGQARLVRFLIEAHASAEEVDRAFLGLLDLRRNGVWRCPCDAGEAMNAVVAYAALQPAPPNFSVTAEMPGVVFRTQFRGYANTLLTRRLTGARLPHGNATLTLSMNGKGKLYYLIAYRYAIQGNRPGAYAGLRLERIVRPANEQRELARFGLALPGAPVRLDAGHVFAVEDRITTDHPLNAMVLTDPLPASFEAVDTAFQTSTRFFEPGMNNWEIAYQQIYRDRVVAYAQHLEAGVYAVHYLVRSVTPGTFTWPAAQVYPQYAPEDFGRTAVGALVVR
jgi:uncharacterized protein YfaS (alpha-2-macroglobulin family)